MAEAMNPRFQLLDDDQLQDLIDSADSKNTKNTVKYAVRIFEGYLQIINTDLDNVNKLPNSELDKLLPKFYAGVRQKNGSLYCKKSMLSIPEAFLSLQPPPSVFYCTPPYSLCHMMRGT